MHHADGVHPPAGHLAVALGAASLHWCKALQVACGCTKRCMAEPCSVSSAVTRSRNCSWVAPKLTKPRGRFAGGGACGGPGFNHRRGRIRSATRLFRWFTHLGGIQLSPDSMLATYIHALYYHGAPERGAMLPHCTISFNTVLRAMRSCAFLHGFRVWVLGFRAALLVGQYRAGLIRSMLVRNHPAP